MKDKQKIKDQLKIRRVIRIRAKINGSSTRPRLAVFRSLKHLSVQAIDDMVGKTLASALDTEVKGATRKEKATLVGQLIAKKLLEKKIEEAIFDKRHYKYHGLVKLIADGAREGGLKF